MEKRLKENDYLFVNHLVAVLSASDSDILRRKAEVFRRNSLFLQINREFSFDEKR